MAMLLCNVTDMWLLNGARRGDGDSSGKSNSVAQREHAAIAARHKVTSRYAIFPAGADLMRGLIAPDADRCELDALRRTGREMPSTWNHKSVLRPILRDGHGACHRARIRATRW